MTHRMTTRASVALSLAAIAFTAHTVRAADEFTVTQQPDRIHVAIGGQTFTDYVFTGHSKPILYPIIGPGGAEMTRNYPMKEGVAGESQDHPHHKSLWFTHGDVNGVDFWAEYPPKGKENQKYGKEVQKRVIKAEGGKTAVIQTENEWVQPDGKVAMTDERTITMSVGENNARIIDYVITLKASNGDVHFGDTKEGAMGIRTNPALNLSGEKKKGEKTAAPGTGHSVNSEGVKDVDMWGKRANWVDYWGPINGKTVGVAIFDHPSNLRHPSYWHARDYGLIAANPWGASSYDKTQPKGSGAYTLKNGESLTLKYRFIFHEGDADKAHIAQQYAAYAK
jgi:hypothetical protein